MQGVSVFCDGGARPPLEVLIAFIDDHRATYRLEPRSGSRPICGLLPIAPLTYRAHVAERADPTKASARAQQDLALMAEIQRVHDANFGIYGARKVWRQLGREDVVVARCAVERLMRRLDLRGAVRGKETSTTIAEKATPGPADKVNRQFRAPRPNVLRVSDFTYVATWRGFVYMAVSGAPPPAASQTDRQVAIVLDVFARRIVGW